MASTFGPRVPWVRGPPPGIHDWTADKDTWELYHLGEDWSQASDLAAEMPGKFAELKELFLIEATRAWNVLLPFRRLLRLLRPPQPAALPDRDRDEEDSDRDLHR